MIKVLKINKCDNSLGLHTRGRIICYNTSLSPVGTGKTDQMETHDNVKNIDDKSVQSGNSILCNFDIPTLKQNLKKELI